MRKLLVPVIAMIALGAQPALSDNTPDGQQTAEIAKLEQASTTLNEHVVVDSNVVRLGDLFTNAGEKSEASIAYAPSPGKRAILDARWLYRVARAYKLDWRPLGAQTQAVVERDSVLVPHEDIRAQVLFELADEGVAGEMDVEFSTRNTDIYLPASADPIVKIKNLRYQPRTGRFSAVAEAGSGLEMQRIRLTGRAFRTVEVPVLTSRVLRGDVITENDIAWIKLKADRVQPDVIVSAADLIGKTPKRGIRASYPIRNADVSRPVLVEKNSLVTIIHQVPNMILTAQGKALQNGADGDVVQIKNDRSNQVIEAEVVGPGRVAVRTASQEIALSLN